MRILIDFEDEYRSYRDFIAGAFRQARPGDEVVAVAEATTLEEVVGRIDPDLVITSPPISADPIEERAAWVELSLDPDKPSRFRVGGRCWESFNPSLKDLLWAIDEAERLLGEDATRQRAN
jgi:hypothetical protein